MSEYLTLSLVDAKKALLSKQISSVELTKAYLARMEEAKGLNAYVCVTHDRALADAAQSDENIKNNTPRLLEGIPLGIKDLFCTKGIATTSCSQILKGFIPPYESTVTQNLWDAGGVCLGKTNMDEFAMGSANITSVFGPVISPWKKKSDPSAQLVPGGSSGGSAAAVAAHMAVAATGSDTGGSIRQPAAFCGLVGIKPTYGLCSRWGMIAFASSLDQAGPLTRTVTDAAYMLEAMTSYDVKDATSLNVAHQKYSENLKADAKGLRVGIVHDYIKNLTPEMKAVFQKGIDWLQNAGAEIKEISLETSSHALTTYYIIAPAEASTNLARFDGVRYGQRVEGDSLDELYENTRSKGFGEEVQRRIMIGCYVLSAGYYDAYYVRAQKIKQLIREDFKKVFCSVDVILTPTTPTAAFGLHEKQSDPIAMYLNDVYTVTANIAGLPALSVPAGCDEEGLPLGFQLIGPAFSEQKLLNTALVIEEQAQFVLPLVQPIH